MKGRSEGARRAAEGVPDAAEGARGAAESVPGAAEGARRAAEGARGVAVGARGAAEGARRAAEGARKAARTDWGLVAASWMASAADILFPRTCLHCRMTGVPLTAGMCPRCVLRMRECLVPEEELPVATDSSLSTTALWYYRPESPVRSLHRAIKFFGDRNAALQAGMALGRRLLATTDLDAASRPAVVPLPSHRLRIEERGYFHVLPLAQGVADALGVAEPLALLERTSIGPSQTKISATKRTGNVAGVFRLRERGLLPAGEERPSTVILVDDVVTSGATMKEAAHVLESAGFTVRAAAMAIRREPPAGVAWRR